MAVPFLDMKAHLRSIDNEVQGAIRRVLDSGWLILGKEVAAFEEEFAAYIGVDHVVGVGSGTDALHLALRAAGIGSGDEVITAANTCVPTVTGISASGALPVPADINEVTMTLSASSASERINNKTKAIVPVHLYGHPCNMDALQALSDQQGLVIIEDCAQAHGAQWKGRKCGSFGLAGAFSFYPSKNLGALGDGGAITTNDAALAKCLREMRNYGEIKRYYHSSRGYNSRLDELQAAVLRVKLAHLDAWNATRRELAALYSSALSSTPLRMPVDAAEAFSVAHLFPVRTTQREAVMNHLSERDIQTLIHYPIPFHLQEAFADLGWERGTCPVAETVCDQVLSLPLYPELGADGVAEVCEEILGFFSA